MPSFFEHMKYSILVCAVLFSTFTWSQAAFKFEHRAHKFPKTKEGKTLHHVYTFTNIGDQPLVIEHIKVACSCTKYSYPKEPVAPGKMGKIVISFDTKGKIAWQDRTLEIQANTRKNPTRLRFKVQVDND